jgi:hypothetical protein
MRPVIVFPFHDTDGLMFAHLETITPQLEGLFARAFVSISPPTQQALPERVSQLKQDDFFEVNFNQPDTLIGDHFRAAYQNATLNCSPEQVLHLCTIDRVAFALQSEHKAQFIADISAANGEQVPVLFQRSEMAWQSHPRNYWQIEHLATRAGEILFDKTLDFAWCHLVIQTQQLRAILPQVKNHDLSILAEIILLLKDEVKTRAVDWLAWEDPFIFSGDPNRMKQVLENSPQEIRKRLAYTIPVLQLLLDSIEKS